MQTANELLSEGTCKLQAVLSSSGSKIDSQAAKVACLLFEAVREKQKEVNTNNQKLIYQQMFLLHHQRKESQSKCELSYFIFTPLSRCSASSVKINFVVLAIICWINVELPTY